MRKRRLSLESLEKRLVLSGVGQPDADQSGPDWQSVIVSFKDDVANPGAAASALMQSAGGHVGHVYQHALKGFSATLPAAAVEGLSHNPMVEYVEPNQVVQAYGWPSGTPYVVPHGVDRIDAELSQTNWSNVDVAIIDTGIDRDHLDLNVVGGTHFYTPTTGPPNRRVTTEDDRYDDDAGHGSHVAGIVGALENERGVVGVAPGAKLWAVKVLDSGGYGTLADIAAGVDWVVERAADIEVINMSLGLQGKSLALHTAIQDAVNAGIVVVVAAGNDAQDVYGPDGAYGTSDDFIPASYPEVMAISAMVETDGIPGGFGPGTLDGPDDSFAAFSNYSNSVTDNPVLPDGSQVTSPGNAIDLVLPGVNLWSAWYDGSYVQLSGTSMASPHAAGLAARYIAEHGPVTGASGVAAVRQALIDNAIAQNDPMGLTNGGDLDEDLEPIGWATSKGIDHLPSADVTLPAAGAIVSGSVSLEAVAFNEDGDGAVDRVEFFAAGPNGGDQLIEADATSSDGWGVTWDTTGLDGGLYKITAKAFEDTSETEQFGISSPIFVTVDNGSVSDNPPSVELTAPSDGSTVAGTAVDVTADASDDIGVTQVEFFVDGSSIGVDYDGSDGWSASWDTTSVTDGAHTIVATATDTIGQTSSDPNSVTVSNGQAADTMYVCDLSASVKTVGNSGKWQALVDADIASADGPVSGATVSGSWSNGTTTSGLTGSDGTVRFVSGAIYGSGSITFTVTNVTHATYSYDTSLNADPEGDFLPGDVDPDITVSHTTARSSTATTEFDALAGYLASTSANKQSDKKDADDQTKAVDLLMAYGL